MLRWFREWRQRTADTTVRFLVTGSIGLDSVVRNYGFADTMNDFDSVTLPPLSEVEAAEFITRLGRGVGLPLNDEHAAHMIGLLGSAWPYFVQIFVAGIQDSVPDGEIDPKTIDVEFLDGVYADHLIASSRNKYSQHMWDRIDQVFPAPQDAIAKAVLRAVGKADDGIRGDQMKEVAHTAISQAETFDEAEFCSVLDVLKHDGYLIQDTIGKQRTRFLTNVLRDYWRRRNA